MKITVVVKILMAALALTLLVSACVGSMTSIPPTQTPGNCPAVACPAAAPPTQDPPPTPAPTPTALPQPKLAEAKAPVLSLPPLMIAIDESESMSDNCDTSKLRYAIPRFLINIFADLEDQNLIQPSSLSLYYLAKNLADGKKSGTFSEAKKDVDNWGLISKSVKNSPSDVPLIYETFKEYKTQLINATDANNPPELIFITDGDFKSNNDQTKNTKNLLRDLPAGAKVYIVLVCPQKYEDTFLNDYWNQRASESGGKVFTLGTNGLKEGMTSLMSGLLSNVGWPAEPNDGSTESEKGWGILADGNGKSTIIMPANTLHLKTAEKYIYILGKEDFNIPIFDYQGGQNHLAKNIYPNPAIPCGPRLLDISISKRDLGKDDIALYWWHSEPVRFALTDKFDVPLYVYNNLNLDIEAPLKIETLENDPAIEWEYLGKCYELDLEINQKLASRRPLQGEGKQEFKIPTLDETDIINGISYSLLIYYNDAKNGKLLYQSALAKGEIQPRYTPSIIPSPTKECRPENGDTTCTITFKTAFLAPPYFKDQTIKNPNWWIPSFTMMCGNSQIPLMPLVDNFSNSPGDKFRAKVSTNSEAVLELDQIKKWVTTGCNNISFSWDGWSGTNGWEKPKILSCDITWDKPANVIDKIECK